jgi:hypothetical protein
MTQASAAAPAKFSGAISARDDHFRRRGLRLGGGFAFEGLDSCSRKLTFRGEIACRVIKTACRMGSPLSRSV